MGFLATNKFYLLFLVISSSLILTSSGRRVRFISSGNNELANEHPSLHEEKTPSVDVIDEFSIHERLMRETTQDYRSFDPSPTLHRPRNKLIPN
ncbi:hypothetical protein KSS87_016864 [Heliosperma pusillum]|nr:hypothetical protein KSS87_016864 [Heliosperma pusillum]